MPASVSKIEVEGSAVAVEASPGPRWVRPAFAALLVATAAFWTIGLSRNGWGNTFYAAAVQAGTESWKAFLFGSSDAANSITVDKPPASLWVMEISTRLFGVNTWSLQLPQVLLGVASVAVVFAAVRRPFGPAAGLIAGALLALTPVATLMFRYNNPDALLVFLMVAATWALLRAVDDGRTRWILLCGALIGLGFLTKQLQVLLVLPGLAIAYLVAGAPARLWTRLLQLVAGLTAAIISAGWWVALVELWPKSDRPFIGGSADNSFLQLTLGYNGLGRILGDDAGGAGGLPTPPSGGGGPGGSGGPSMFGSAGITRMFSTESATQISWLLPAALVLLAAGLVLCGRVSRTDRTRACYLAWGSWLLVTGVVFSFMSGIFHDYYTVALAPAVAAVVGSGSVHLWRHRDTRWVTATLALVVVVTTVWAWVLLSKTPDFVSPLRWIVAVVGAAATVMFVVSALRPGPSASTVTSWAAGLAVIAALAGPVAYCVQTVSSSHQGPIVTAGPSTGNGMPPSQGLEEPAGPLPGQGDPSEQVSRLLAAGSADFTWVAAASGSLDSAGYQLATGDPVMPIGGFAGADPSPTLEQFQDHVSQGRIHYYLDVARPGMPSFGGGSESKSESDRIRDWVTEHYTAITVDGVTLYDLTSAAG